MTNKQMTAKKAKEVQTEIERLETIRKFTLENHNDYLTNLKNATHALMNSNHMPQHNRVTLKNIIGKCEQGALRTRREVTQIDNEINFLKSK